MIDPCGDELKKAGELIVTRQVRGMIEEEDSGEAKKKKTQAEMVESV